MVPFYYSTLEGLWAVGCVIRTGKSWRRARGQLHGDKMLGRKWYLFILPRWKDCGLLGASYAPGKMIMKVG